MLRRLRLRISPWSVFLLIVGPSVLAWLFALTLGKKYDALVELSPTDIMVQSRHWGAGVSQDDPLPTNARLEATKALAEEAVSLSTLAAALMYLGKAASVEAELGRVEGWDSRKEKARGETCEAYEDWVTGAMSHLGPSQREAIELRTGTPSRLWARFLYLQHRLAADHSVPPGTLSAPDAFKTLSRSCTVHVVTERGAVIGVRHRYKTTAEVLASAIAAVAQYQAGEALLAKAEAGLRFLSQRSAVATERPRIARSRYDIEVRRNGAPPSARLVAKADLDFHQDVLNAIRRQLLVAEERHAAAAGGNAMLVTHWAGVGGVTEHYSEVPALPGGKRLGWALVLAGLIAGVLLAGLVNFVAPEAPPAPHPGEAPKPPSVPALLDDMDF